MKDMKDSELRKIFLDKIIAMKWKGNSTDYKMRKMAMKLHEEFDRVWLDYGVGNATYDEWEKALDNWLSAEMLA